MDFQIKSCWRYTSSGSLDGVIRNVNYQFIDSGSSAEDGILNYERTNYTLELGSVDESSFIDWDSVTTSSLEGWVMDSHGDSWGSFTSSIASTLTSALNARSSSKPTYQLSWPSGSHSMDTSAMLSGSTYTKISNAGFHD